MKAVLLVFIMSCVIHAGAKTQVHLRQYAEVSTKQAIKLKYLTVDTKSLGEIGEIVVFPAKPDGTKMLISRIEMARTLDEKIKSDKIVFNIPQQIVIESKTNFISSIDVENHLQSEIEKKCSCVVQLNNLKMPFFDQKADWLHWRTDLSLTKINGPLLVPLKVQYLDVEKTYWISVFAELYKEGFVARKNFSMNERIEQQSLEKKLVNITFLQGSLAGENELVEQLVSRPIAVGQPLLLSDIKREMAAKKGQLVHVQAGGSELEISMQAISEESGYIGDVIKIRNSESQKILSGKIVGKGVVKVE